MTLPGDPGVIAPPDPARDRSWSPACSNRNPVDIQGETAPRTAIDYSSFWGVGRDPEHAFPHRWRYMALAIQDKLSIQAPHFLIKTTLSAMVVPGSQVGGLATMQTRGRFVAPDPASYAANHAAVAPWQYSPQYAKIL